jgi:hypothetical protein
MGRLTCRPLAFLISGFSWLLLSSLLGLAILIGLVHGTPLPTWLRSVHVHATLIGGILQLMIGGLLASQSTAIQIGTPPSHSHLGLLITLNVATVAVLVGFGFGNMTVVGVAGIVVIGAVISIASVAWLYRPQSQTELTNTSWLYRFSLTALLVGLAVSVAMAFRLIPEYYAHARLLHLHVTLMGFIVMAMIGATQQFLPVILNTTLYSPRLARFVLVSLPAGFTLLIGGFIASSLYLELAIGGLLIVTIGLYSYNLLRTWMDSGHPGNATSDHLLAATFFLVLMMIMGVLVGANFLPQPPALPFGSLHLAAYTHMALIGFILQTVFAAFSHGLPDLLATDRVTNVKIQRTYQVQLAAIMNRWRAIQLTGLSLGTMGLGVLAAMTWNVPFGSLSLQIATWVTVGLLLSSLTLFTAKLAWALGVQPSKSLGSSLPKEESFREPLKHAVGMTRRL